MDPGEVLRERMAARHGDLAEVDSLCFCKSTTLFASDGSVESAVTEAVRLAPAHYDGSATAFAATLPWRLADATVTLVPLGVDTLDGRVAEAWRATYPEVPGEPTADVFVHYFGPAGTHLGYWVEHPAEATGEPRRYLIVNDEWVRQGPLLLPRRRSSYQLDGVDPTSRSLRARYVYRYGACDEGCATATE